MRRLPPPLPHLRTESSWRRTHCRTQSLFSLTGHGLGGGRRIRRTATGWCEPDVVLARGARRRGDFASATKSPGIQITERGRMRRPVEGDGALGVVLDGNIVIARRHGSPPSSSPVS